MSKFTFLTEEQCFGDDKLDILEKRGTKAAISDFSILLGGEVYRDEHIEGDSSLAGRTGGYWTKSDNGEGDAHTVHAYGKRDYNLVYERRGGARPVLPFASIEKIPTNGKSGRRAKDGILEVEYGYYPQKAVSKDMQRRLEEAYTRGTLSRTRNTYTTDSIKWGEYGTPFKAKTHEEYEYNGKRYVRVEAKPCFDVDKFTLSNGEEYSNGDNVWVEVSPVKWLVDEKAKIMITEKLIFAGVQFNEKINYHTRDFDKTDIKRFMDKHLAKELVQSIELDKEIPTKKQTKIQSRKNENPYNLEFGEVSERDIIKGALESNVSIFLHGKPGCGKSDRVKQLDPDFIELNLSHLDPELLDGLAGEKEGRAVHIKPPWLEELEAKCEANPEEIHILFLEELTNASPMMQAKAYGIALDKKVAGRWKLPENARVVAAGNELEDSLVANEMAEPLYDRFAHVNIETTVDSWLQWAVTPEEYYERIEYKKSEARAKIHPSIYAYISYKGEEVLRTPYNRENPQPHADPRRWKMASDMLYASNNPNTLKAIIGEELTRDFVSYCKMPTITVEDVIAGNYTDEDINIDTGRKLATIAGLVKVDEENMPKVREFVSKLGPEMCRKFEVQWTRGDEERLEQIQELRLKEQEEAKEHSANEAKQTGKAGMLAYKIVNGEYEEFLAREKKNEDNEKGR